MNLRYTKRTKLFVAMLLVPFLLESRARESEGFVDYDHETCGISIEGNFKDEMVACDKASKDSQSLEKRLEQWMDDLKLKFLNTSNAMEVVEQVNRKMASTQEEKYHSCFNIENIAAVSVKNGQHSYRELWNSSTSQTKLKTLSALLLNKGELENSSPTLKLTLHDGKALESPNVADDFSVNGAGILFVNLEDDELLLTTIAENITLHGEFVNGCLNGLVFGIAQWWKFPTELDIDNTDKEYIDDNPMYKVLNFVGQYKFGKLFGPIWKPTYSLDTVPIGFYYSYIPENGETVSTEHQTNQIFDIKTRSSMFIYPDFSTAIYGKFHSNGVLISGSVKVIGGITYLDKALLMELTILERSGQKVNSDISSDSHLSRNPLVRDPYESKYVDIRKSKIPNAGEGVFLKKNVSQGKVIAYFNGIRIEKNSAFSWNPFKKKSVFLIDFQNDKGDEIFLDIPERFTMSKEYNATSGHKVNHSNSPNSAYTYCRHPIYGKIICCHALKDLGAGTELTVKYSVTVNSGGMKSALKTALHFGHLVSGKPKDKFIKDVKPYLDIVSKVASKLDNIDLVKF